MYVLNAKVNVDRVVASKGRHGVTSNYLSQKWLISLEAASRTVQHITQRGIRTILYPSLSTSIKNKWPSSEVQQTEAQCLHRHNAVS